MKFLFTFILLISIILLQSFNFKTPQHCPYLITCDSIPAFNKRVIVYVKTTLGKKIGKGECWDLAAYALNSVDAKWNHNYVFGKEIKIKTECIYPGDIIQFEGVKVKYEKNGAFYTEEISHHTAIIYEVKKNGTFIMAEQNTSTYGKKVGLNPLDLKNIIKGKYKVFRPVSN